MFEYSYSSDPFQYSAWDGTQELPDFSADEILDQLADDLLRAGDPRRALRNLLQRGFTLPDGRRFDGLRRLIQQMQRERESMLDRYDPSRMIDAIKDQLDEIINTEREGIDARRAANQDTRPGSDSPQASPEATANPSDQTSPEAGSTSAEGSGQGQSMSQSSEAAGGRSSASGDSPASGQNSDLQQMLERMLLRKEAQLNELPPDNAGRIRSLKEYDFISPEAREAFEKLIGDMQRRLLQEYAQGLKQGIGQLSPEDLAGVRQMILSSTR